jgi:hypothetical protein
MAKPFDVTQGHLNLIAEFSEPQFSLLKEPTILYRHLLQRLGPHGLRLADMKFEWGDQSLAEYNLRCFLFAFGATLRFRAERLEMLFDAGRVPESQASEVSRQTFEAVRSVAPDSSFRTYTSDIGLHGVIANVNATVFLADFTKEPPNLGPSTGSGCVFYFGPHETRLSQSVTLDLSGMVKDGVYVRDFSVWDGSKISPDDLLAIMATHVDKSLQVLGLERAE